ncbi:hypothetical protein ZIOFF_067317 [Zingiber officinale]|uniref:Dilute domain-containing protein n=1 Tax=Zingiber officinale TaxID=94328 RepID=A0A8J5EVF2_ZINOF|nr:hypothetical protein ZIOFF_067317 [Zingiber officinale]
MLSSPPALAFASEGEGFRWMKSLRPFSPPGKIEDNQAQKMFGNRWTEIAKVVSGRYHISPLKETIEAHRRSLGEHGPAQHLQRPPLLEVQNFDTVNQSSGNMRGYTYDASNKVSQATFLGRDDPKLTALLQQAELLTTLSKKVNAENTNQSLDEAWKELQEYLIQTEDSGLLRKRIANFVIRFAMSLSDSARTYQTSRLLIVLHQKPKKTLKEITKDLCPVLSIQQLYRISTMYWDDKYGTQSVTSEFTNLKYSRVEIDEVRIEWAECMLDYI